MLYYEGLTCPVCHKHLKNGEDIVSCPQCGLPHHRVCWMQENKCHDEVHHGTEEQWSREKAIAAATKGYIPPKGEPQNAQICPQCFTKNAEFAEFCTHCGRSLGTTEWHSAQQEPHEYVSFTPAQYSPLNAEDQALEALVGVNTQYYIPRFRNIREGRSGGWNWAAFLLGPLWLFYRKQYLLGGLMFVFQTVLDIATMWLMYPINSAPSEEAMLAAMEQMAANPMMIPALVLSLLLLAAHFLLGAKGNHLYLHHCTRRIQRALAQTQDLSVAELNSFGGVTMGVAVMFYLLSSVVSNAFAAFLFM